LRAERFMTLYRHVPGFGLFRRDKEFSRENSLLFEIEQLRAQIARLETALTERRDGKMDYEIVPEPDTPRDREHVEERKRLLARIAALEAESGWLIELGRSPVSAPEYWCGSGWSTDHMQAVRFARRIDAERTAAGWDDEPAPETPYRICEHGWS